MRRTRANNRQASNRSIPNQENQSQETPSRQIWGRKAGYWDHKLCESLNTLGQYPRIRTVFSGFSRLGDGLLWYALLTILPFLYGLKGLWVSLITLGSCYLCMNFYSFIKSMFVRERPFVTHKTITPYSFPLDRYSLPSGHCMSAAHCAIIISYLLPSWGLFLGAVFIGIALSRMILGLHYPSDVVLGTLLGTLTAFITLFVVSLFRNVF